MLPDFGWTELLVISIVLIVVIGPKDLPKVLRGFGRTMTSVRRMAGDFRKQFDDALREAELDDVRKLADDVRSMDPRRKVRDALNPLAEPLREAGKDIDSEMKKAMGDRPLPELPKSPPQMGLDQAGDKARAAQSSRRKPADSGPAEDRPQADEKTPTRAGDEGPAKPRPGAKKAGAATGAKAGGTGGKRAKTSAAGAGETARKTSAAKGSGAKAKSGPASSARPRAAKASAKAKAEAGPPTAKARGQAKKATGEAGSPVRKDPAPRKAKGGGTRAAARSSSPTRRKGAAGAKDGGAGGEGQ